MNGNVIGDAFSLRNRERVYLRHGIADGDTLAFMCAAVPALPTPSCEKSASGDPVTEFCIVGSELVNGKWQWMQLAPDTKEFIGSLLFDYDLARNVWHGAVITTSRHLPHRTREVASEEGD